MAEQIPQLPESTIFSAPKPADKSAGFDAFATVLGNLSAKASAEIPKIESEQSNAMYMNSVGQANQIKYDAQGRMLQHPDQADTIAKQASNQIDSLVQNTTVNKADRGRLNYYTKEMQGQVNYKAVETEVKQHQIGVGSRFYQSIPSKVRAIDETLGVNPKKGFEMIAALNAEAYSAAMIGAISPSEVGSVAKLMDDRVEGAKQYVELAKNANATTVDLHRASSDPLKDPATQTHLPTDHGTQFATNYFNSDHSFSGVKASLQNHMIPDMQDYLGLTKPERMEVGQMLSGIRAADGYINSAQPLEVIQRRYNELSSKGEKLYSNQRAEKDALEVYLKNVKDGNTDAIMQRDPQINAALEKYNMKAIDVQNDSTLSPQQKYNAMLKINGDITQFKVAVGKARNWPDGSVQPLPQETLGAIDNAFSKDGDPNNLLRVIDQYPKQVKGYIPLSQKGNDDRRMVVAAVTYAPTGSASDLTPVQKQEFIAANQVGARGKYIVNSSKELVDKGDKDDSDKSLINSAYKNLMDQKTVISANYTPKQADELTKAMYRTTVNYAYGLAFKHNDLKHPEKYIEEACQIYQKAFPLENSTNWIRNPNQTPIPLSSYDMDAIADDANHQGYEHLREGRTQNEYENYIAAHPLHTIITETGYIKSVNSDGQVAFSAPLTNKSVTSARVGRMKRQQDAKAAEPTQDQIDQATGVQVPLGGLT